MMNGRRHTIYLRFAFDALFDISLMYLLSSTGIGVSCIMVTRDISVNP